MVIIGVVLLIEKAANSVHLTLGKDDVKLNSNNSRANSSLIRCVKIQK